MTARDRNSAPGLAIDSRKSHSVGPEVARIGQEPRRILRMRGRKCEDRRCRQARRRGYCRNWSARRHEGFRQLDMRVICHCSAHGEDVVRPANKAPAPAGKKKKNHVDATE